MNDRDFLKNQNYKFKIKDIPYLLYCLIFNFKRFKSIIDYLFISELVNEILDDINRNPKEWKYLDWEYKNWIYKIMKNSVHKLATISGIFNIYPWYITTLLERYLLKKALKNNWIK